MSQPRAAIVLDNHASHYLPGETLAGECRLEGARSHNFRAVELSVLWSTLGQGEEDLGVHFFKRIAAEEGNTLDLSAPLRFEAVMPNSPLSYDGVIVKLGWCVRVRLFPEREKEIVVEKPFRLGTVSHSNPIQTSSFTP